MNEYFIEFQGIFISPVNEVQEVHVYRNDFVCLPVCLQIRVRPITFFWFDIGLQYLTHGCITLRRCVAYIYDLDTTSKDTASKFYIKVKFIGLYGHVFVPITIF